MRITEREVQAVITVLETALSPVNTQLFLYGSRTKDNLKGGDIDLLLILPDDEILYRRAWEEKYSILAKIKDKIGDQKIDLLLVKRSSLKTDPFVQIIYPTALMLHAWEAD